MDGEGFNFSPENFRNSTNSCGIEFSLLFCFSFVEVGFVHSDLDGVGNVFEVSVVAPHFLVRPTRSSPVKHHSGEASSVSEVIKYGLRIIWNPVRIHEDCSSSLDCRVWIIVVIVYCVILDSNCRPPVSCNLGNIDLFSIQHVFCIGIAASGTPWMCGIGPLPYRSAWCNCTVGNSISLVVVPLGRDCVIAFVDEVKQNLVRPLCGFVDIARLCQFSSDVVLDLYG